MMRDSQLIVTIDDFAQCLNTKGLIHAIFLDFAKAFDKVPHKKFCHTLASYDITGPILEWISDFYPTGHRKSWWMAKPVTQLMFYQVYYRALSWDPFCFYVI